MTKLQEYTRAVRNLAIALNEGETCDYYLIEDITHRTEKTFINKLIVETNKTIKRNEYAEISTEIEKKMIGVLENRMKVILQ